MLSIDAIDRTSLDELMDGAQRLTLAGHGSVVTYSRKVFIPLTQLCRDVCRYCTFAKAPRSLASPYLSIEQCLDIARAGAAAGCKEALFTLGDQPEQRYSTARRALDAMGYASTLDYVAAAARAVFEQTGLLPHLNPGVMSAASITNLRAVSASMGLMLETASERLSHRGGPHWGSPDK
ncbi:MAG: fbiC, partial [Gammaproteobacteria bacterium]|nr:fbiC [Gammaproteobacteria bacterium]